MPYSAWPSAGRRRRRLPVQRVHSRLAARVRRRSVPRAACAQRWTRPVGAHRTRQHVNCSCQVRKSARGLAHIRAGTRPHPRGDCPTSAPGLAHICDGFGYTQCMRSHTHAWAHTHTYVSSVPARGLLVLSTALLFRYYQQHDAQVLGVLHASDSPMLSAVLPVRPCVTQPCDVAGVVQQCNLQRETLQHSARPHEVAAPVRRCSAYYCSVARGWHRT